MKTTLISHHHKKMLRYFFRFSSTLYLWCGGCSIHPLIPPPIRHLYSSIVAGLVADYISIWELSVVVVWFVLFFVCSVAEQQRKTNRSDTFFCCAHSAILSLILCFLGEFNESHIPQMRWFSLSCIYTVAIRGRGKWRKNSFSYLVCYGTDDDWQYNGRWW